MHLQNDTSAEPTETDSQVNMFTELNRANVDAVDRTPDHIRAISSHARHQSHMSSFSTVATESPATEVAVTEVDAVPPTGLVVVTPVKSSAFEFVVYMRTHFLSFVGLVLIGFVFHSFLYRIPK